jgi:hypothetical protein
VSRSLFRLVGFVRCFQVAPSRAVGLSMGEKDGPNGEADVGAASEKRLVSGSVVQALVV